MPPTGLVHIQTAVFSENNPMLGGIIQAAGENTDALLQHSRIKSVCESLVLFS